LLELPVGKNFVNIRLLSNYVHRASSSRRTLRNPSKITSSCQIEPSQVLRQLVFVVLLLSFTLNARFAFLATYCAADSRSIRPVVYECKQFTSTK